MMDSDKIIFVVSSCYLEAVHKESTKYSFELIGCGGFKKACQLIANVSVGSLLGISIVEQKMPAADSEEGKYFMKFVSILGDLQQKVRLNIVLTQQALDPVFRKRVKQYKNVDGFCHANAESVTDSVINNEVFGSLFLDDSEMYEIKPEVPHVLVNDALKVININNYFSEYLLGVVSPCVNYADLQQTCIHDSWYQKYVESNDKLLQIMRQWYVGITYGFDHETLKDQANVILMDGMETETFPERYILYDYLSNMEGAV